MSSKDWDKSFIERFKHSGKTELLIAIWLLSQGEEVRIPEKTLRKHWSERLDHADDGDLIVNGKRCEVKGLRRSFKFGQWAYPYALVCSKWSYDRAIVKPKVFFLVSADQTCTAVIDVEKTFDHWFVVSQQDRERNETYDAYAIDPSWLEWHHIE